MKGGEIKSECYTDGQPQELLGIRRIDSLECTDKGAMRSEEGSR